MALTAAFLVGCTTPRAVIPPGTICVVNVPRAPLFKYGPAQSFGADLQLDYGTRVSMIERSMGYCRVMTQHGITGYIADDQIDPLPPEPKPKQPERVVTNRKLPRVFSAPVKRSNVAPVPGDPLFDMNDVPLPVRDEPPATPKPTPQSPKLN